MRILKPGRLLSVICAVILCGAPIALAAAQQGMRAVGDPAGRFTMSFPRNWTVVSIDSKAKVLAEGKVPEYAKPVLRADISRSGMMAFGPSSGNDIPPTLVVLSIDLPKPASADNFADLDEAFKAAISKRRDITVTQQGTAKVAGHQASYVYFTETSRGVELYGLQALFPVGRVGFMVVAFTPNDPDRVRSDFALISKILETLRLKANS
jgi:hypothetical protein